MLSPFSKFPQNSGYQAWEKNKKKREQSKAPVRPLQFENPTYKGKSESKKTYDWEKNTLKDLSIKKYGRSYNDKFETWAREQGIPETELNDFRSWLDSKEDGARLKGENDDKLIEGIQKRNQQSLNNFRKNYKNKSEKTIEENDARKQESKKKEETSEEQGLLEKTKDFLTSKDIDNDGERDGLLGAVDRFVTPISKGATESFIPGNAKMMAENDPDNPVVKAMQKDRGLETTALNMAGVFAGFAAPYTKAYKAADVAINKVPKLSNITNPYIKKAVTGALAGGMAESGVSAVNELANPEANDIKDYAFRTGLGVVGGAVLDPALYGAGRLVSKGAEKVTNKAMQGILPSEQQNANAISTILKDSERLMPTEYTMPDGTKIKLNNRVPGNLNETTQQVEAIRPRLDEIDSQINEMELVIKESPEQEEVLRPLIDSLQTEKESILNPINEIQQQQTVELQRSLTGEDTNLELPDNVQAMRSETIPMREATGDRQFKEMGFFESAINSMKKSLGGQGYEKPISRRELLNGMRKNLGVTIRTGRLGAVDDSVKGYYKVNPEVIRSRQYGDIQVISHEIGHHLDKQFSLSNEMFDNELMRLGANTSAPDYTPEQIRNEGLAEYIRLFLTDPERAVSEAPIFSQHFDEVIPNKVKKGLLKTQSDVDRWIEQGPELRLRGKIDRTGKEQITNAERIDKVYSQFIDKFDRLKKVEMEIDGQTQPRFKLGGFEFGKKTTLNSAEKSIYKQARLSVGAPKIAEQELRELKAILKPIDKYGITTKDVGDYSSAVHALDLENMGERVVAEATDELSLIVQDLPEMDADGIFKVVDDFQKKYGIVFEDDQLTAISRREEIELTDDQIFMIAENNRIESGMTKKEIESTIAKYDTDDMKHIQQQIVGYNNRMLDKLVEGQILTREAVESMREKYPNYVPFFRFFDEDMSHSIGGGGKGFTNLSNPVKRLKGSTRDVIDPLESMVKNTFAVVNAVEKNKVGLELSRLADIDGAGRFVERLDGAQQVPKENIVTVFENGERVQYQLDKDLYDAVQQLDEDVTNKIIQLLSVPTSMLRAGATLTPEFMIRNPIRDQFQAFVVSNYGYNPIIDLPKGIWEVFWGKGFNKSDVYRKWAMNGGGYGNYLSQDRDYLRETLKTLKKEGKWYQKGYRTVTNPKELGRLTLQILRAFSEFSEEATKVGEFRKAMNKGATVEEAAFQSRDLMDFGRVGSDMRQWNRAVAFLNANLQGKDRIARAFKNNPARTTIRALTGVTLPAYAAYMAMEKIANDKQKEIWKNTPKWMKDTFFLLPVPGTDEVARIPKPFDLAPVFANPVEQIMDYIKDNDPEAWDEFLKRQGVDLINIPHMLTGLTPAIENITNYSFFTGGTIVPRRDQDLLPQDQYGVNTSLTARTVGDLTRDEGPLGFLPGDAVSPYKVDNLIRGYGAGLGKYATSGLDSVLEKLGVGTLPPPEKKKWSELPIINAFMVDSTGGGQVMTDFYDALDKLTKEQNSAKRNQRGYERGDDVNYERKDDYKYLNKVSREISELRNEYRDIQSSYDLTPKNKRTQLDELDRQMNKLAKDALVKIGEKNR